MSSRARAAAFFLVLACGPLACAWSRIRPETREVGGAYTVHPQIEWSGRSLGDIELWTVHGPRLEALRLTRGIGDGGRLLAGAGGSDEKVPVFRSGMSESEMAEFVADAFRRAGAARFETRGLRPAAFGGRPGFRFELDFATPAGLEMTGLAAGTELGGKLYLILFTAPRGHYFDRNVETAERVIESVRFR